MTNNERTIRANGVDRSAAGARPPQARGHPHPRRHPTDGPGPADADLPEHDETYMAWAMSVGEPDWSDRNAAIAHLSEGARRVAGSLEFDEAAARIRAARELDRARDIASRHNTAFADHGKRWRERLGAIDAPTLVVHGTDDPFFPYGNGQAPAREIPRADLITLTGAGHELPSQTWSTVVPALIRHTER